MRVVVSILVIFILLYVAVYNKKALLVVVPITAFSGFMFSDIEVLNPNHFMVAGLAELILLILIALGEKLQGVVPLTLLVAPLAALPSLLQAGDQIYLSIYFITMMSLCAFLYQSQRNRMDYIVNHNIIDYSILVMVAVALVGKLYTALTSDIDTGVPFMLSFLMARDGAIAGSNFITQLIFTLLPLSRNNVVRSIALCLLLITFSRGAYLCMSIYLVWYFVFSNAQWKGIVKVCSVITIATASLLVFNSDVVYSTLDFAKERIVSHESSDIESRYQNEERFKIFKDAINIADNSYYLGVGLGGFYYAQNELQGVSADYSVSNAHNLYLTLLAEGGLLPFILLLLSIGISIVWSWPIKQSGAPLAIILLSTYFLFSGSFYESSRYVTLAPYYLWVFLLAYIDYYRKKECSR